MRDQDTTKKFPEGFFWGAATASYQVEGGIENCDWAQAAREGRVPVCGRACDFYHRYEEDLDIAKELRHNCHRLSVEWARIEPQEGTFDAAAIAHYRKVITALRARGMEPFITIWHFTIPQWFADKGGFEHPDAPRLFARYAAHVADQLGDLCSRFATMNEPHVYVSNGWRMGTWPPFKKWPGIDGFGTKNPDLRFDARPLVAWRNILAYWWAFHRVAWAHNAAYRAIKAAHPSLDVGLVKQVLCFHGNGNPIYTFAAWVANIHWTHYFLWLTHRQTDSIGLNYYIHKKFGETVSYHKTDMGWDIYPAGVYDSLMMLKRYKKPIYVSEAGIADAKDLVRGSYIKALIANMHRAIEEGVDLRGYMYWSLLDNYEWALGFDKRFGLVEMDYGTLERSVRPSAHVYKAIIERNALVE